MPAETAQTDRPTGVFRNCERRVTALRSCAAAGGFTACDALPVLPDWLAR